MPSGLARSTVEIELAEQEAELARRSWKVLELRSILNTTCRINSLPLHLLAEILLFYRTIRPPDDDLHDMPPYWWIRVTHVCRRWRDVALNTPTLWSNIIVTRPEWVHELLIRARQSPLTIIASASKFRSQHDITKSLQAIFKEISHVRSVTFRFSTSFYRYIFGYSQKPLSAPLLRELVSEDEFTVPMPPLPLDLTNSALEKIHLSGYSSKMIQPLLCPAMTHLFLEKVQQPFSRTTLLNALEGMPLLLCLGLYDVMPSILPTLYGNWHVIPPPKRIVSMPRLKSLTLFESDSGISSTLLLDRLSFPATCQIHLHYCSPAGPTEARLSLPPFAKKLAGGHLMGNASPIRALSIDNPFLSFEVRFAMWPESLDFYQIDSDAVIPHQTIVLTSNDEQIQDCDMAALVCKTLPLSQLRSLSIGDVDFTSAAWLEAFRHLTLIESLHISWDYCETLPLALCTPLDNHGNLTEMQDAATFLFPKLKALSLQFIHFRRKREDRHTFSRFYFPRFLDALRMRKERGFGIDKVKVDFCFSFTGHDCDHLEEAVEEVEWDHSVQYEEDDEESEETEENEENEENEAENSDEEDSGDNEDKEAPEMAGVEM